MITSSTSLSQAEREIHYMGFKWKTVANYRLDLLDPERKRVQVRESDHYAPKDMVKQYAAKMLTSPDLPPIVVTRDAYLIDGNTRYAARRQIKHIDCTAIVVEVDYATASTDIRKKLEVLAGALNQGNGVRLRPPELRKQVYKAIELGWQNSAIMDKLSAPQNLVSQVRREVLGTEKLSKVGLQLTDFAIPVRRALGEKSVQAMNDVPFRELADLAAKANFTVQEVKELAEAMLAAGADDKALAIVRKRAAESEDRIRQYRQTGSASPAPSRMLRQHLGFVNKYRGRAHELVETTDAALDEHCKAITEAIEVLQEALQLQQERNEILACLPADELEEA